MANRRPTPYAFAPTKDGRKLPWELGRLGEMNIPTVPSDSDSHSHSAQSSASPTPQRPARFEQWLAQQEFEEPVVPAPADDEAPPQRRRRQQCTCGELQIWNNLITHV